jgi:hypothetical protein
MPPSYVLTDDASGSSSFVLSERTAPLHKSSSSSLTVSAAGSPKKSKKVLRRRSVDFVPSTSTTTTTTPADAENAAAHAQQSQQQKKPTTDPALLLPKTSVYEYDGPTEEEQVGVWYSRDEYDIIKARNNLIIKMMKGGTFKESDEHTFRGLEHKLKDGFKRRRANKFNALNAVLEEQDAQFARGRADPDSIAEAYRLVSLSAKENAFLLGSRDAEESYCHAASPRQRSKKKVGARNGGLGLGSLGGLGSGPGGSPSRPRHSSLSDLLQQHHDRHYGTADCGPEDDDNNNEEEADADEDDDDDDDSSTATDLDTVSSESSTAKRKSRLRSMFGAVSLKRKEKINRRTSL